MKGKRLTDEEQVEEEMKDVQFNVDSKLAEAEARGYKHTVFVLKASQLIDRMRARWQSKTGVVPPARREEHWAMFTFIST